MDGTADGSRTSPPGARVDAVLFDMDGTLVDSTPVVEQLWTEFCERHGAPLPEVLSYSHGRQAPDTVGRFLPRGADPAPVLAWLQSEELERVEGIREVPGARRLLDALAGARVAVVTSAPRPLALRRLEAAGLPVPRVLVAAEDVSAGKPDPAGYLRAAAELEVEASRCLVLEDAEAGVRAGIAAGARVVVVGGRPVAVGRDLDRVPDLSVVDASVSPDGSTVSVRWRGEPDPTTDPHVRKS